MTAPEPSASTAPPDRKVPYSYWWPLIAGVACGALLRLLFIGKPGQSYETMGFSFIVLTPLVVGAVTVFLAERQRRRSWGYYFAAPFTANLLLVVGSWVTLIEGLICALLVVPLFGILGGIGGLLMGTVCRWTGWPKHALLSVGALPLLLGAFEHRLPLPQDFRSVERSQLIAATPEQVWKHLVDAPDIAQEEIDQAWMYRIGVPLPVSGTTEFTPDGPVRHVRMGMGIQFDQVAREWQPAHRVRWAYRFHEHSIPPGALDDHVAIGGRYFDLIDTTYTLEPEGAATRLRVSMSYRVSTQFNWYVQPIADFLVGDFEEAVLQFYARRAAQSGRSVP